MPSLHHACTRDSLSLHKVSLRAMQSVSISTGKLQTMSLKWSSLNFSAANSKMYGLYCSSAGDICLDANPIGWIAVTISPLSNVVIYCCDSTAPKPSLHPSVVSMNGVLSNLGAHSTGSEVGTLLSLMNALSCCGIQ